MEVFYWILGVLAFIVMLALSIGLHEAGHRTAAKWFKLSVPRFFVGFGPTLWSHTNKKGEEYGLKAIPLGGFVLIEDDRAKETPEQLASTAKRDEFLVKYEAAEEELNACSKKDENYPKLHEEFKKLTAEFKEIDKAHSKIYESYLNEKSLLSRVTPWKRIVVFAAGPAVNLVLGVGILMAVLMSYPSMHIGMQVDKVNACATVQNGQACGAESGGLKVGDKFVSINGVEVKDSKQITPLLSQSDVANVVVERSGSELALNLPVSNGAIGINLNVFDKRMSFTDSVSTIGTVFVENVKAIANIPEKVPGIVENIFGAKKDPEAPSSIVSVGKTYGDTSASEKLASVDKVKMMLLYSGLLNVGLGFINLLPIGMLDGSKIGFALMDSVKILWSKIARKKYNPVSMNTVKYLTVIGAIPLLFFMGIIILSDVLNIGRGWM